VSWPIIVTITTTSLECLIGGRPGNPGQPRRLGDRHDAMRRDQGLDRVRDQPLLRHAQLDAARTYAPQPFAHSELSRAHRLGHVCL
jgi:hypothetical protein